MVLFVALRGASYLVSENIFRSIIRLLMMMMTIGFASLDETNKTRCSMERTMVACGRHL